ncbi:hypothetical protein EDD21DRAFT_443853 [Dissophora ornata]|nr:hypothetical protein EDD21DRAFT_443853 [Dissophora ornata]
MVPQRTSSNFSIPASYQLIQVSFSTQAYNTTSAMPFFKRSSKNQSTSAASTPAQTPRSSMQATRPSQTKTMTAEQALEMAMQKSMWNVVSSPSLL